MDYIKRLPINDDPDLFGMHANADITCAQALTTSCLQTLLMLQPKEAGGEAQSQDDIVVAGAKAILEQLPKVFNLDEIMRQYVLFGRDNETYWVN